MDENINSTIEAALQDKMIDSAREADLTISFLRNQLWKEEEQIKTAAARERQAVEHLSSEIDFAKRKLIEKFPNLEVMEANSWSLPWLRSRARKKSFGIFHIFNPDLPLWPDEIWKNIIAFFLLLIVIALLTIVAVWFFSPAEWVEWMMKRWRSTTVPIGTLIIIGLLSIFFPGSLFYIKIRNRQREEWFAGANAYKETLELNMLEGRLKEVDSVYGEALLRKGALFILREIINTHMQPSYDITLPKIDPIGLAEVYDPEFEVPTRSKERLTQILNSMPGGSIGVAGPRGVGKSTLLRSFCSGGLPEFKGLPVLSILAFAPAEYQARDFILHLFSQLTKQVLAIHKIADTMQRPPHVSEQPHFSLRSQVLSILGPLRPLIIFAAIMLLLIGIGAGMIQMHSERAQINETALVEKNGRSSEEKLGQKSTQDRPVSEDLPSTSTSLMSKIIKVFGVKAGNFVFWGIFLFAIIFVLQRYAYLSEMFHRERQRTYMERGDSDHELNSYLREQVENEKIRPLVQAALKWQNAIKFQQSFTSGWSGSLTLPMGIGMGVNEARTFAQYQMSLPEIATGFRDFLAEATLFYQIFIGIDELDKIRTEGAARQFLNDIKIIFGVEKCFFLISISENAMSNFERRGLPFRDEFDSSFDDVVHVDYLDFEGAFRLIKRRVIGMPVVFVGLCHSLTGGLARDLIRMCRSLFAMANTLSVDRTISMLCSHLITQEVRTKLRALEVEIKKLEYTPHRTALSARIQNLKILVDPISAPDLQQISKDIESIFQPFDQPVENELLSKKDSQILIVTSGILSFLEFCSCILEVFSQQLNEEKVKELSDGAVFEGFANVRQTLAVDPALVVPMLRAINANGQVAIYT